jgi:hypothetical protein
MIMPGVGVGCSGLFVYRVSSGQKTVFLASGMVFCRHKATRGAPLMLCCNGAARFATISTLQVLFFRASGVGRGFGANLWGQRSASCARSTRPTGHASV